MNVPIASYTGKSGLHYEFEVYPIGQEFKPLPGVYVVGRFVPAIGLATRPRIEPLYVGETKSFVDRLNTGAIHHDGYKRALALNATQVAVRLCRDDALRLSIETDLRHSLDPICNRQPVPSLADMFAMKG